MSKIYDSYYSKTAFNADHYNFTTSPYTYTYEINT